MKRVFFSPFWEAVGIVAGMIIGSGMFVLPYAVSVSGLWPSVISVGLAFWAVLSLHLAYGEIVIATSEQHRLPGYATIYLGRLAGVFVKISQIIGFNAALLVYGVLGGIFLSTILGGAPVLWIAFFFGLGALIFLKSSIEKIGFINFLLTIPLIISILFISFMAVKNGDIGNIYLADTDPFFSFGVFVFAFAGLSVIADAGQIFRDGAKSNNAYNWHGDLKKVIIVGTVIPLVLYIFFTLGVLMASGAALSQDSLSGLIPSLGNFVIMLGAVIGFLAMFTSYLALGYDLKEIYTLDLNLGNATSWLLAAFIPPIFYFLGFEDFVRLIGIVGGTFLAFDGLMVIFILRKMRKTSQPFFRFLKFKRTHQIALILVFTASIAYEIIYNLLK